MREASEASSEATSEQGEQPDQGDHAHHGHHALSAQRQAWWRRFNQLTGGACAGAHGRPDVAKVKAWQLEHGLDADGKVGRRTVAAARGQDEPAQKEEVAAQPDGEAGQAAEEKPAAEEEPADPVEKLVRDINRHGLSPHEEERLKKELTVKSLERLLELLKQTRAPSSLVLAKVEKIKTELEEEHETRLTPHGEGEMHVGKGKTKAPIEEEKSSEFTHQRGQGQKVTHTGDEAHKDQEEHEDKEKKEQKEKGRLRKWAESREVTLKKGEVSHTEGLIANTKAIDEKHEFGDDEGFGGDLHYQANHLKGKADYKIGLSGKEGLTLEGNASATATLVAGGARIHTPPLDFSMNGEQMRASFTFFVDAGVLAEAKGKLAVNLHPKGEGGVEAEISGFAGGRATVGTTGELVWTKRSPDDYVDRIVSHGGAQRLFDMILPNGSARFIPDSQYARLMKFVLPKLLGKPGDATVLGLTAKGEGSVGIGASASFSGHLEGGKLRCHGKAGLTIGAGLGGNVDLELGLVEGGGLLAVLALMDHDHFEHALRPEKDTKAFMREQARELMHAVLEGCREAERDPKTSWWVRQLLQNVEGTLSAVEDATPKHPR